MAEVRGIHHITMLASSAPTTDAFWRGTLGLARVKRTVNADRPDAYHLFYGDGTGAPGTLLTVHPFPNLARGAPGAGEIAEPAFAVSPGAVQEWRPYLERADYAVEPNLRWFDHNRLIVEGPDGERVALQVSPQEQRPSRPLPFDGRQGLRGIHSVTLRVREGAAVERLLGTLGYGIDAQSDGTTRYRLQGPGNGASTIDVLEVPGAPPARMGAGSVHHLAFSVADGGALDAVHAAVRGAGFEATEVAGRTWFDSFYFRGPDDMLFEVATDLPGLTADGVTGDALALPAGMEEGRDAIERTLEPLEG